MPETHGRLALEFEYDPPSARTLLHLKEQRQPLKVVRAFHSGEGEALVHLHNLSGGVLAGDRLSLEFNVGPRAHAQVTSTGSTRLYRSRLEAQSAECLTSVRVAEDALLEYLPDPVIPFAGARYKQNTVVDLERGAGLFWWETVAPGREARGEVFSYDALRLGFELRGGGIPLAIERNQLNPSLLALSSLARMGPYRYFSSFYICRMGVADSAWRTLEKQLFELAGTLSSPVIIWGLGRLPAHGFVVRALSFRGREIASGLIEFWRVAKLALYGRVAVIPRKVY